MSDFMAADVGRRISAGGGYGTITGYTSATTVTVTIEQPFPESAFDAGDWTIEGSPQATCTPSAAGPVGSTITLTLSTAGWRDEDVGKFVQINGGLCRITSKSSTTIVNARVETELTSAVAAEKLAWSLEGAVWGGAYGYPRTGTLYEQRLWLAGSVAFPQRVWGSVIGQFFDFTLGTFDDDALSYDLASGEFNPILHLAGAQNMVALTDGGEFTIRGGQEKAITPTNIRIKDQSAHGCNNVKPARIGNEVVFVQRAGRKVRALTANQYDSETYNAPDMAILSEHITESGIRAMAFQSEPNQVLWCVRNDGVMATFTFDRDQETYAWTRQTTFGRFTSVCTVPAPEGDRVFVVAERVIGGEVARYIERLDSDLHTDSAITGTSEDGATLWTGLEHLEGLQVRVKGDGILLQDQTVSGGQITVERDAFEVEIGLDYISTVQTLTPELGLTSPLAGAALNVREVQVLLQDTVGCTINLQDVGFRRTDTAILDSAPEPFSGFKTAGNLGWERGRAQVLIQQTRPYPWHVQSVILKLTANEG